MKNEIKFELAGAHHCTSFRLKNTIIFKCPLCPDYERKIDLDTGSTSCKGKNQFLHTGSNDSDSDMSGLTLNLEKQ